MFFRSYADMVADVQRWSQDLPEFAGVLGVPRSGLMVASVLALYRNIPLLGMDEEWYKVARTRRQVHDPDPRSHPFLIMDDSTYTGESIKQIKQYIKRETEAHPDFKVKYAAYLAGRGGIEEFDYVCWDTDNIPQLMEWSTLHIPFNRYTLSDLDGVICEDWPYPAEEGPYADKYTQHLTDAKLLIRPTYPLKAIVTSRLEKWRPETQAWLDKYGIKCERLYMNPATTQDERFKTDGFEGWKSRVYSSIPDAQLFVESNHDQAMAIAFRTEKYVLDWAKKKLVGGRNIRLTSGRDVPAVNGPQPGLPVAVNLAE